MLFSTTFRSRRRSESSVGVCRMLYNAKEGKDITPALGHPRVIGECSWDEFPLYPFYKVDSVLFLVVTQWASGGIPENRAEYLAHCINNGEWNTEPIEVPKASDMHLLVDRVVNEGPWKRHLTDAEIEFLKSQVCE